MQYILAVLMIALPLYAQEEKIREHERKVAYAIYLPRYKTLEMALPRSEAFATALLPYRQIPLQALCATLGSADAISDTGVLYGLDAQHQALTGFSMTKKRALQLKHPLSAVQAWKALYDTDNPYASFALTPVVHVSCTYPSLIFSLTPNSSVLGGYNLETGKITSFSATDFEAVHEWHRAIKKISMDGETLFLENQSTCGLTIQGANELPDDGDKKYLSHTLAHMLPLPLSGMQYKTDSRWTTNAQCTTIARPVYPKGPSSLPPSHAKIWHINSKGQKICGMVEHPSHILNVVSSSNGLYLALITKKDRSAHLVRIASSSLKHTATILRLPHYQPQLKDYYLYTSEEGTLPYLIEVTDSTVTRYNFFEKTARTIFEASTYDYSREAYTKRASILSSSASPNAKYLLLKYRDVTRSSEGEDSYITLCVDPPKQSK